MGVYSDVKILAAEGDMRRLAHAGDARAGWNPLYEDESGELRAEGGWRVGEDGVAVCAKMRDGRDAENVMLASWHGVKWYGVEIDELKREFDRLLDEGRPVMLIECAEDCLGNDPRGAVEVLGDAQLCIEKLGCALEAVTEINIWS